MTRDAAALLVGRTFRVEDIAGRGTLDAGHPELTFGADGRLTGRATINRVMGPYSIEGDVLTAGPLATTMMAGAPAAMDQEQRLLEVLATPLVVIAGEPGTGIVLLDDGSSLTRMIDMTDELSDEPDASTLQVTGAVVYPQRIALPPDAVTTVRIEETSRADAPSMVVAEHVIEGGQVPIPFLLRATRSGIPDHARLVVTARIECDGELLWITDTAHLVDAESNTEGLTVPVVQVGGRG